MNDRRAFFGRLIAESETLIAEVRGTPHYKLSELDGLSDVDIGRVIPVLEGAGIRNGVPADWPLDRIERTVVEKFGNGSNLSQLASTLARTKGQPYEKAFPLVRRAFLKLVKLGGCRPLNDITV
ncbi:MAG: hypothetical protein GY807_23860 [Gammaproteobacteria bacterium]|nr:hypothetical protein [Gammaproteobacteria bacterium]